MPVAVEMPSVGDPAPADLIKFLGSLTGQKPEKAESPSGNKWCKEPT